MRKNRELTEAPSCLNKALDGEMLFVLLARDEAAPAAIRAWAQQRVSLGLNQMGDAQIIGALDCADTMDEERAATRALVRGLQ